ncbi:hypothetical protein PY365_20100 [Roseiarcaceae bacterium H3SJ34-1]|uniref:hypothetical protein n=1 Tax=Terripilifer ovatus TaxID=3032367 RepID=UPI003AB9A7FB|nr:hypothetical protein [Roseiarcaceae bacterium H3SJ34-1]
MALQSFGCFGLLVLKRLMPRLRNQWVIAIFALAFMGILQFAGSETALASGFHRSHSISYHSESLGIDANQSQLAQERSVEATSSIYPSNYSDCQGNSHRTSGHNSSSCCGTPCCAAALAPTPDSRMTPSDRIIAISRFYPQFIIADVVFGLDRPPDFCA